MAIVVVDINEGFRPQTIEALQILRNYKTPFVIAANKVDRIHGWRAQKDEPFIKTFEKQNERVQGILETKVYELSGNSQTSGSTPNGSTGSPISRGTSASYRRAPSPARGSPTSSWC